MTRPEALTLSLLALVLTGLALVAIALGSSFMPLERVVAAVLGQGSRPDTIIVWNLRMPRTLLAILAGAMLAVSGMLMQRATRNPLAAPSVLGIEQGAALGVLFFLWAWSNESNALLVSIYWQPLAAVVGAALFALLVGALAMADNAGPTRLLLYGVAFSALAQALVILVMIAGPVYQTSQAVRWLAGTVAQAEKRDVTTLALALAAGAALLVLMLRPLDQMRLDDQTASGTGLPVTRTRLGALALSVGLAAAAVSVVGGVGFVGLIAPHAARLLVGTRSLPLVLASAGIGAAMVLAADLIVRALFTPLEVPAGAVTALLGAPYFLYLLIRGGRVHA